LHAYPSTPGYCRHLGAGNEVEIIEASCILEQVPYSPKYLKYRGGDPGMLPTSPRVWTDIRLCNLISAIATSFPQEIVQAIETVRPFSLVN
jgi:hypothetical protein